MVGPARAAAAAAVCAEGAMAIFGLGGSQQTSDFQSDLEKAYKTPTRLEMVETLTLEKLHIFLCAQPTWLRFGGPSTKKAAACFTWVS